MRKISVALVTGILLAVTSPSLLAEDGSNPYGWVNTETLTTRFGDFQFENGYPVGDTAQRLFDVQTLNRGIDVYLTQLMPVSERALREGLEAFGAKKSTQLVIWENLMDAQTVLLTANGRLRHEPPRSKEGWSDRG